MQAADPNQAADVSPASAIAKATAEVFNNVTSIVLGGQKNKNAARQDRYQSASDVRAYHAQRMSMDADSRKKPKDYRNVIIIAAFALIIGAVIIAKAKK